MSFAAVVLEGAQRAARFVATLFTLNAAAPSAAPPVAPDAGHGITPVSALGLAGPPADSTLTLAAQHLDVQVEGDRARVRTTYVLRNDDSHPVAAHYLLPVPARVLRGDRWPLGADRLGGDCDAGTLGDDDLPPRQADLAEIEPPARAQPRDVIVVPPGEAITLEVQHELPVEVRGDLHRLVLPLSVDRAAPWVPRFSADVLIEAARPVRRLASPTHEALVAGIGEPSALLTVPEGFVYRQKELAIEFELDATGAAPRLARAAPAQAGR